MSRRHLILATCAVATLLAGCGPTARVLAPVAGMVSGASPAPRGQAMPKDGPQITVTLTGRGIRFPMRVLEREGDVTTWVAADGAQMETRNGIVIATRGFGQDLMSSVPPTLAELGTVGNVYERRHYFLDGTDVTQARIYACTVEAATGGDGPAGARHVTETCIADRRRIVNEYWLGKGGIRQSRQFISPQAGYVIFSAP